MKSDKHEQPYSQEAEQAVIASALIDNTSLDKIIDKLLPVDFYMPVHRYLFRHIVKLHENNQPVDIVTLLNNIEDKEINKAGGLDYISSLIDILPSSANMKYYAKIVREKSIVRQLINTASEVIDNCYGSYGDIDDLVEDAEKRVFMLAEKKANVNVRHLGTILPEVIDSLDKLFKNINSLSGTSTGYTKLDELINGLQPSDLIIMAGRPGMGKTAFALNVALNAAVSEEKKSVAFFTLEMSSAQLVQRLISALGRVESAKIRNGYFTQKDWQNLIMASGQLSDLNFFLDDTPAINPLEMRAKCRRIKREHGLDLVFVDYLQLMSSNKGDNREQQISDISRSLKALAKELNVPVVALSQLNRAVENRSKEESKRPRISDLRESGAIEQDAYLIMFLYRDVVYTKEQCPYPDRAEVLVAKHRHGATDDIRLRFVKEYMAFENE
ncbi:MAG: replicative DNA helicase [Denitrovibrio sp.]|nr:MAG: replicative DNA helicase [Denitrovibrio sp.]